MAGHGKNPRNPNLSTLACRLEEQTFIADVLYLGLERHPRHEIARKQIQALEFLHMEQPLRF